MNSNHENFSFNLDVVDHAIVESLRSSVEDTMPEIMSDNNLQERNGYNQFRWNVIIAKLREKCHHLGWADIGICPRGGWKTPVLFHPASGNIITFMTEGTFLGVQKRKDKGRHYLCGGASYNKNVVAQCEQLKLELPGISPNLEKWVAKSKEQLAASVYADIGEISGHILVLFDAHTDKLLSVRAVRLTPELEISTEEENWSRYIKVPYSAEQEIIPQQNSDDFEEELVELL